MKIAVYSPDGKADWDIVRPDPNIAVWLDGRKVDRCVAADDVAGVVWVTATGENGHVLLNEKRDEVLLEQRTGTVEIRLPR